MPTKPSVLIADKVSAECAKVLAAGGIKPIVAVGLAPGALAKRLQAVDGVIVRSATKIRKDVLGPKTRIRVIGRAGIGVDNIDVDAASSLGIAVLNTPDANAATTAELAVAHMFSVSRHLPAADANVRSGKWERAKFMGAEISGKTVGVVGFGTIGKIVAARCRALAMRVLVCDPFVADEAVIEAGCEPCALKKMLPQCDYLTLHAPLTAETAGLIGAAEIALLRPEAYVIQCARGGIVDERALAQALNAGKLAGAAIDVFVAEPPAADNPLLLAKNTVLTPHLGAATREAQAATGLAIARQLVEFFATGEAINAVNLPRIAAHEIAGARPYAGLARSLGKFMAAAAGPKVARLNLRLAGEAAGLTESLLLGEALIGLLADSFASPVNQVNALRLAAEHGIKCEVTKCDDAAGFASLIGLEATAGRKVRSAAGTLLGGSVPRLASFDGLALEAPLAGQLLITRHADRPGAVAKLTAQLAKRKINISTMHVSPPSKGGDAAAVIGLNRPLAADAMRAIERIEHMHEVLTLKI